MRDQTLGEDQVDDASGSSASSKGTGKVTRQVSALGHGGMRSMAERRRTKAPGVSNQVSNHELLLDLLTAFSPELSLDDVIERSSSLSGSGGGQAAACRRRSH